MTAIRSNFADELDPAIRKIFFDDYNAEPEMMPKVFNILTSDRDTEMDSATTGFGKMVQTSELGALDYEDPLKMFRTSYSFLKYTKGFKVSQELLEDDQHNIIMQMPRALAKAVVYTTEDIGADVFNNGFNTSFTSYGDGDPLLSTLHGRVDGGSNQSNASATGITLGETNLETARLAFEDALDDKGQIRNFTPNTILVGNDLRKTAVILTDSSLRPGTANNDVNIYEGAFNVKVWKYITSTTAWFLTGADHKLNFFWRIRPEFKNDYNFDADAALYKVRIRVAAGWSDWRSVWGSKGDGAAYSS
jgi:hypothetical protein